MIIGLIKQFRDYTCNKQKFINQNDAGESLGPLIFFSKSMKGKILNILYDVEKVISPNQLIILAQQVSRTGYYVVRSASA